MNVDGKHYRTIWVKKGDNKIVQVIDQKKLPHEFIIKDISNLNQMCVAIKELHVRGAGLIGASAAYGMYLAALEAPKDENFDNFMIEAGEKLKSTRPTAVNLQRAVHMQLDEMKKGNSIHEKIDIAFKIAKHVTDEDAEFCKRLGEHGVKFIEEISKRKNGEVVNILTHCNAGFLAFVDYGTATAPIYEAFKRGIKIHVWVDETRPHNKGIRLTSWELMHEGIPHTNIVDNVGGHLMQHGMVDMVITGADRVTYTGFVANQIGTYLKALAANDNNVPFYVALPSSTFDWTMRDGVKEIPIEERDGDDTKYVHGLVDGEIKDVLLAHKDTKAATYIFDVTPPKYVTALITERGICKANEEDILRLYPEHKVE